MTRGGFSYVALTTLDMEKTKLTHTAPVQTSKQTACAELLQFASAK